LRAPALPAACLVLLAAAVSAAAPAVLSVQDAWIRATPGVDVAAVYLTLRNTGSQPAVVTGVRSPAAQSAMIHQTTLVNGESTMRPQERLRIAAGETVRFAPGGLHIMLHGLKRPLAVGDEVPVTVLFEGGGSVTALARVRPLGEG
jgi:periplasmic copper chaperone A